MKKMCSLLSVLVAGAIGFAGCSGGGGGGGPVQSGGPSTTPISVSGKVSLSSSIASASKAAVSGEATTVPDAGVTITSFGTANNKLDSVQVSTGSIGFFTASVILSKNGGYIVLDVSKDGFTGYSKRIDYTTPADVNLNAELRAINAVVSTPGIVMKSSGATVRAFTFGVVKYANGTKKALAGSKLKAAKATAGAIMELEIEIPASTVPADVTALVGKFETFDSSNPDDAANFPGAYADANGNKLVSLAFDYINITDDNGNNLGSVVQSAIASGKLKKAAAEPTIITRHVPQGSCGNLLNDFCTGTGDDALCANLGTAEKEGFNVPIYTYNSSRGIWDLLGMGTLDTNNDGVIDSMDVLAATTTAGSDFCTTSNGAYLRITVTNTDFLKSWWNLDYPLLTSITELCIDETFTDSHGNPLSGVYASIYDDDYNPQSFTYASGSADSAGKVRLKPVLTSSLDSDRSATLSYYDPYTYSYNTKNVTLGTAASCATDATVIVRPRMCRVEGKIADEGGAGKANQYVMLYGSAPNYYYAWATTDTAGLFAADVRCEEDMDLYVSYDWTPKARVNVNGAVGAGELSDNGEKAVASTITLQNLAPYAYGYLNTMNMKTDGATSIWVYGYDYDGNYPLAYSITSSNNTWTARTGSISSTEYWKEVAVSGLGAGNYPLTLVIKDSLNKASTAFDLGTLTVTAPATNRPPTISYAYPSAMSASPGDTVNLYSWAYDLDGNSVTYAWTVKDNTDATIYTATSAATSLSLPSNAAGNDVFTVTLVVSDGMGGSDTRSFTITTPCTFSISPTNKAAAVGGDSGNISVTASSGCSWNAASNATSWISITSDSSGSGDGSVLYSVASNTAVASRTGTMTVAGRLFTVSQPGAACSYSVTAATPSSLGSGGGSGTVTVTPSASGCSWNAYSNDNWITITSGSGGSGNGAVGFYVAPNTAGTSRSGTVTVAGIIKTITQAAATCSATLSPTSGNASSSGGTGSFGITVPTGCAWSASVTGGGTWLAITSAASGTGSGTITYSVAANVTAVSQTGTISVMGKDFMVYQAGAPCSYSINPVSDPSVAYSGGSGTVAVTAAAGCSWSSTNSTTWIHLTNSSATGNGTVDYTVDANPSSVQRTGTVTIAGKTFTVTQAGAPCIFSLTPSSGSFGSSAGSGSIAVTSPAGCAWTAASNDSWITVSSGSPGSGNGTLNYSVSANTGGTSRSGSMTVAGQAFTVTQSGVGCTYSISPTSVSPTAAGSTGSVTVTAPAGCSWSAASNDLWISITGGASGSGNGTMNYSVSSNPDGIARTGTMTIQGQTFTVNQGAATCSYLLSATTATFISAGGSGSVDVTSPTGCGWTATSNAAWISITGGASSSGNGTANYTVAANTAGTSRTGTVTIAGQTYTVTQAGVPCTFGLSATDNSFSSAAGTGSVTLTSPTGCNWTAVSNDNGWLTVTAGASGSGNGTVNYSVSANTGGSRTGTMTIAGQTYTVTQAGVSCSYSVSPMLLNLSTPAASGSLTVTTTADCTWTSSVTAGGTWLSITAGTSGTGSGSVSYAVTQNDGTALRIGTIEVMGNSITVTQDWGTNGNIIIQ